MDEKMEKEIQNKLFEINNNNATTSEVRLTLTERKIINIFYTNLRPFTRDDISKILYERKNPVCAETIKRAFKKLRNEKFITMYSFIKNGKGKSERFILTQKGENYVESRNNDL